MNQKSIRAGIPIPFENSTLYWRLELPLSLIVVVVATATIPVVWPLH